MHSLDLINCIHEHSFINVQSKSPVQSKFRLGLGRRLASKRLPLGPVKVFKFFRTVATR